jgi:hypothetical protein
VPRWCAEVVCAALDDGALHGDAQMAVRLMWRAVACRPWLTGVTWSRPGRSRVRDAAWSRGCSANCARLTVSGHDVERQDCRHLYARQIQTAAILHNAGGVPEVLALGLQVASDGPVGAERHHPHRSRRPGL